MINLKSPDSCPGFFSVIAVLVVRTFDNSDADGSVRA